MGSLYLGRLTPSERENLVKKLYESQKEVCFLCEKKVDLILHKDSMDIDHIVPLKLNGKDDPSNFALTHSSCNRSKQASDLNIARLLHRFENIKDSVATDNRGPNLQDILLLYGGSKHDITLIQEDQTLKYSLPDLGDNQVYQVPLYRDDLSGFEYFFVVLPIEYLHHDDKINPRSIGPNISKLLQEFYLRRPQLHVSLGWVDMANGKTKIRIFDGQHKAAAQVLLGVRKLPVRIFINPDPDVLLTTNTNAGTFLRQVAFDKSVQRHLGSALYVDRVERYKNELGLPEDHFSFSESDLVKYFKGESREMKRYILDSVRDSITHNTDNKLKEYMDFGGRAGDKPLSYSTVEKTFYSFFIHQEVLNTPIDYRLEEGENPRYLEKQQILLLMNIVAEEIFLGKFDVDKGTNKMESRVQKGDPIPLQHIRSVRMAREEIMYNWLRYIQQIIKSYFIMQGKPIQEDRLFQYKFPEPLWDRIRIFIRNLSNLPVWINKELSATVFGGKQVNDYWQTIFETGKSPQGLQVLAEPINLMEMIKE